MPEINFMVIETEIPNVLVAQGIESDLCVQGKSIEDLQRRAQTQIDYYVVGKDLPEAPPADVVTDTQNAGLVGTFKLLVP